MSESRDETHVEQHGDGDVNVTPAESPAPAEGGDAGEQGGGEDAGGDAAE